ncbi:MAG TPA: TetR family transcriptional regulator [Edaphobacter sp.]|uniref:TetR/AcrR family transcriptional regulator n=1 Tax=Edaphobacter sp. TaxID=1934404 RepID=UPI002BE8A3E9|nr:TetR family transcriptional regulator [Edaphobacter sp.]HUZ93319.1 TetR family transcriptional regulator [Edaphobacter sp.]
MPISDCEVRDPRIRRTRQLLQGALRELMQTRSFDEISVQDITDAATVNRATFYDHYTDKFSLLDAMVGGGFHKLLHERNVSFDGTCPSAAASIILATCDYLTESHGDRAACTRQNAFEPLMESAMTAAIRKVLSKGLKNDGSAGASEMVATTASWAIYGAVKQWFYTPDHAPAEEIVGRILLLVMPILEAGRTLESPDVAAAAHN